MDYFVTDVFKKLKIWLMYAWRVLHFRLHCVCQCAFCTLYIIVIHRWVFPWSGSVNNASYPILLSFSLIYFKSFTRSHFPLISWLCSGCMHILLWNDFLPLCHYMLCYHKPCNIDHIYFIYACRWKQQIRSIVQY